MDGLSEGQPGAAPEKALIGLMGAHAVKGPVRCLLTTFFHDLQLGWHPAESRPTARSKNVKN